MNGGAETHPEWIQALQGTANALPKPTLVPGFFSTDKQNSIEVEMLKNLSGGYGGSSFGQFFNPDVDKYYPGPLDVWTKDATFKQNLIEKIKKGVQGCCLEK